MDDSQHADPRTRYVFLLLASLLSLILYLDRICIAESAQAIAGELGLGDLQRGWMFSAFTIGYMLFEVPSGAWGDRYGPRRVLCRVVVCWSVFTILTGCVARFTWVDGFLVLLVLRFVFGAAEAGAYPNIAKLSGQYFPLRERGLAQGIVATAGRLGGGIASGATIAVTVLAERWLWPGAGWRAAFWFFGLWGIVWVLFFLRWSRGQTKSNPSIKVDSAAEPRGVPWLRLLTRVNLLAFAAMAFCSAFVVYLYFTRFPEYLEDRHHVEKTTWGWVAGLPMIGGAVGCTLGGVLTDWLTRRTGSRRWGRRLMGLVGKGGGALLLLAGAWANDPVWAVVLIALSAFVSDLALAAHWAVCTDTGGRFVGTVFAIVNTAAAVGAGLSPVAAGYVLNWLAPRTASGMFEPQARAHAWNVVLCVFAAALLVSAACWLRIDADEPLTEV